MIIINSVVKWDGFSIPTVAMKNRVIRGHNKISYRGRIKTIKYFKMLNLILRVGHVELILKTKNI